jgi:hypothetical protein
MRRCELATTNPCATSNVLAFITLILDALRFAHIGHLGGIHPDHMASLFPGHLEEEPLDPGIT